MPNQKTDDLLHLIRSLTPAEKRHFRLFVGRHSASEEVLFVRLFDFLDKKGEYDESNILKKIPEIKRTQLPNLKAHLTTQLLTSLRLLAKKNNEDIQIRELLDYARVLYNKGLYRQSLDWLSKAKERALDGNFSAQALEIVEFEKLIESQYITHSIAGRAEELSNQSMALTNLVAHTNAFSNLALQMYALYLKTGFARNEKDYFFVKEFFRSRLPSIRFEELDFWGKVYFCQAHVWLYHIGQEFAPCFRYAQKWVDLFRENKSMIGLHPPLYLKGLHNLLFTLFNSLHYERFMEALATLKEFPYEFDVRQDRNIEGNFHLYCYIHRINQHYIEGTYTQGLEIVPELLELIENQTYNWDSHRIMVFYYRIACLYFATADYDNAILFLNKIIQPKTTDYREDIQVFARILCLIAHYELGNERLLEHQIKSVYRFLSLAEELHEVQKEIFRFLRRTPGMRRAALRDEFKRLHAKLIKLQADPFERRPFMYLDIISWLESKIEDRKIPDIIAEKFGKREAKRKSNASVQH